MNMILGKTLEDLKKRGFRITNMRKILIAIFIKHDRPLTVATLHNTIKKSGWSANRTTLYRELEFLKTTGLINELSLSDKQKSYEWSAQHHHHLVCRRCETVKEIELPEIETLLPAIEKRLKTKLGFKRIEHTLEFFGMCKQCASIQ